MLRTKLSPKRSVSGQGVVTGEDWLNILDINSVKTPVKSWSEGQAIFSVKQIVLKMST